jgi:hypothetical protein
MRKILKVGGQVNRWHVGKMETLFLKIESAQPRSHVSAEPLQLFEHQPSPRNLEFSFSNPKLKAPDF